MSAPTLIWLALFGALSVSAFVRPAYGVGVYMLTFFACPIFWWWGKESLGGYRWNLYGGVILLGAVLLGGSLKMTRSGYNAESPKVKRILNLAVLILINATLVHVILAPNMAISALSYDLLAKFVLLFFMTVAATRSLPDFRVILLSILLGAGYIGYEVTINHRGKVRGNRLEGVGAPGAASANDLGCLMVTVMPLAAVFLMSKRPWEKVLSVPLGAFLVNVVLLCNSRGCFLASIGSGITFLVTSPPKERRKATAILLLGAMGTYMLMNDSRIVDRFMTIFVGEGEERDHSAASRLDFWKAGLRMIADHPLGGGGKGFDTAYGMPYIRQVSGAELEARSVHNGYINEVCEWGIQGGLLRLAFLYTTMALMFETSRQCSRRGDVEGALMGAAFISGTIAFMIECIFGSFMDSEWGYWVGALAVAYGRFYADTSPPADLSGDGTLQSHREMALHDLADSGSLSDPWARLAMRRLPRRSTGNVPTKSSDLHGPLP